MQSHSLKDTYMAFNFINFILSASTITLKIYFPFLKYATGAQSIKGYN